MHSLRALFVVPALLSISACVSTAPPTLDEEIDRLIAESGAGRIGISYYDTTDGTTWSRNGDEVFHAASTMKVPVMMALFREIEQGKLTLDQPIEVRNEFTSIFDGSTFSIPPTEDSDSELHELVGTSLPLEELIRRMIVRSSNLATNIVIELTGAARVTELMRELGADRMQVLRGVEDIPAYEAGMNNTATANDLMIALRALAEGGEREQPAAVRMIEILLAQEFNEGIPAGLPPEVPVAHKTGSITSIYHDAAIVYPAGSAPYIIVVLTGGTDDEEASRTVAAISRTIWNWREGNRLSAVSL
jgi:beta-lactamase class A